MIITFIIGNGFDLNLGMKTQYSDMYKGYIETPSANKVIDNFKESLSQRKPYDRWTDFEMGMAKYAKTLSSEKEFIECVRDFKTYMVLHLRNEESEAKSFLFAKSNDFPIASELNDSLEGFYRTLSPNVVNEINDLIGNNHIEHNFLTFNYTSTLEELLSYRQRYTRIVLKAPIHIHGTLNNDVVLGVDNLEQLKNINYPITRKGQRTFVKTLFNEQYDKSRVEKAQDIIKKSKFICIYGWSMGDSDQFWVELLKEWLLENPSNHLVYYKYGIKQYHRYNFDEIMDAEDDEKQNLMKKLGLSDESLLEQIHVPIGCNIFNFDKIDNDEISSSNENKVKEALV